ncbi:hypothetical protein QFZ50_002845 [Arthrobacter agilis]|nr:hypothetical protein [Arthrobacter agilis]
MHSTGTPRKNWRETRVTDRTSPVEKNRAFARFVISWVITALWMGCIFLRAEFIFSGSLYYLNFGVTCALFAVMFGYLGRYVEFHDEQTVGPPIAPHPDEVDAVGRHGADT